MKRCNVVVSFRQGILVTDFFPGGLIFVSRPF